MTVTVNLIGRVGTIRKSAQMEVVNFKLGAPIGRKNDEGKYNYANFDCAAWGSLGTKLVLPYIKEGDYVGVTLELEEVSPWQSNDKSGVNLRGKVLNLTLLGNNVAPSGEDVDELVAATNEKTNPTVSPAAQEVPPF